MNLFLWRAGFVVVILAGLALAGWLVERHDRRMDARRDANRAHLRVVGSGR